jgi:hypothetical protein
MALPLDESGATPAPSETVAPEPTTTPEPAATAPADAPAPAATEAPADDASTAPAKQRADRPERVAAAAAGFGDLDVTVFDDRYADGIFDTSKVARNGETDSTGRSIRLRTADGTWREGSPGADGVIHFDDLPVGEAQIHITHPNGPGQEAFFDATGATSAADIERLATGRNPFDQATGVSTVTIDEDGETRVLGLTGLRAVADVEYADGTPATGVSVELGSAGQWYAATEYGFAGGEGQYEAFSSGGYQIHLPDRLGVRLTAPAGYEIGEVTAISGGGNTTDVIPVTEGTGGEYWIATTDAASFTQNPTFQVTLAELPTGELRVTSFDDRYPDGLFDAAVGSGEKVDRLNGRLSRIVTSQGTTVYPGINDEGEYVFADLPVGDTTLYFTHPNTSLESIFFDATGAGSADDIARIPNQSSDRYAPAVATVTVDEDGEELLVGFTALSSLADIEYTDGTPATGVSVEFGTADGQWLPATEYTYSGGEGQYEAVADGYGVRYLPDEIGLRLEAPAGFVIDEVTGISSSSNTTDVIPVREGDVAGEYWIDTTDASTYFANPTFRVTLDEAPTASLAVTYFADVELDGVFEASADETVEGAEVYLQDAAGDWWATTVLDGRYTFTGIAPGAATVYAEIPETTGAPSIPELPEIELPDAAIALWDATDVTSADETVRAETSTISFEDGRFIDPATGDTTPFDLAETLVGEVPTELEATEDGDAAQQVLIGAASVFQLAAVVDSTTQAPAAGLLDLTFGANAYTTEAEEAGAGTGAFIATDAAGEVAVFGAAEYSITPTVADGYDIVEVQAISALTGQVLEVTGPAAPVEGRVSPLAVSGEYRVAPEQVGGPVGAVVWAVAVAPAAVAPGTGLPATGAQPAGSGPRQLAATGAESDALTWLLAAGLLIGAGVTVRVVRRRNA